MATDMLKLTDANGCAIYIAPASIISVADGLHGVRESVAEVMAMLPKSKG